MPESMNEALVECIKAAGGSAAVGAKLWPERAPGSAQRLLLDCMNEERPSKLDPEQVLFILRLARERGCHAGMNYLAHELSYAGPIPIEPRDERDDLRRQVLEMGKALQAALERIEKIDRPSLGSAA